jgi:hypothetical protein
VIAAVTIWCALANREPLGVFIPLDTARPPLLGATPPTRLPGLPARKFALLKRHKIGLGSVIMLTSWVSFEVWGTIAVIPVTQRASAPSDRTRPAHSCDQPALFEFGTGFLPPETGAPKEPQRRISAQRPEIGDHHAREMTAKAAFSLADLDAWVSGDWVVGAPGLEPGTR